MTPNLTNVYAYLRRTYQNVDMLFAKPVSYLKTLTEERDQKIIFIFKEDRGNYKSTKEFHNVSGSDDEKDKGLNLTGSPLRDDDSIKELLSHSIVTQLTLSKPWKPCEEMYKPINISLARDIIINLSNQKFPDGSRGWIYILCTDENDKSNFLLSHCVAPRENIRGFGKYLGVVKNSDKSMTEILKHHSYLISSQAKLSARIESFFEITPFITLRFVNNTFDVAPSFAHINTLSEVLLYQKVETGKSHVLCEDLWSQIMLLNEIKCDIVSFKNCSMDGYSEPSYSYGSSDLTFEKLQEKVNRILSEMNIIGEDNTDGTVQDTGLETVIKRKRPLTEVTDQLWHLLKYSASYSDLKKIITFIFQVSSRSNIVNIPTNHNRLGELIRELCLQRLAIPHLVGTEPLELLLEIGIEMLMKDYEFIFSESKICKLSDVSFGSKAQTKGDNRLSVRKSLAAAVDLNQSDRTRKTLLKTVESLDSNDGDDAVRNSRFNERDAETSIGKLSQSHLVIEHLLSIQNNLSIENDYITIAKKLFEKPVMTFEDLQNRKFDKFEFPINDKKVNHLVENLVPNAQKITLHSENKFKSVTSVFYFNIEQIIPSLMLEEKEGEVIDKSGDAFHFISYSSITSKF